MCSHNFDSKSWGQARPLCALAALAAILLASPAFAQQAEPARIDVAYERTYDRFHYRFENPSSFDTADLVPHEFTQTYWGDNQWLVLRARLHAGARALETEIGATPQRSTRGDDYDTFFQPSGDVVVVGTTGGVSMRSWRVRQTIGLGRKAGIDWSLGYQYRSDRSEFHPGLKSTSHTQPASYEEFWIYTRETTISRNYGPAIRMGRRWNGPAWEVTLDADVSPLMNGRLTTLLPDKYPGRTIVFNAAYMSLEPSLTISLGRRWPVMLTVGYNRTQSYLESRQFVRNAARLAVGFGLSSR